MPKDLSSLVGTWETEDQDSRLMVTVSIEAGVPKVVAFDKEDGETFEVSDVRVEGDWLSYETHIPSTDYRTRNRIRAVSTDEIEHEFTFVEKWIRVIDVREALENSGRSA